MSQFNIPKMSHKVELESVEIVIDMRLCSSWGRELPEREVRDNAEKVRAQIGRHVDLADLDAHTPIVRTGYKKSCPHCGFGWHPTELGCNWCCDAHMDEWRTEILKLNPGFELDEREENLVPIKGYQQEVEA